MATQLPSFRRPSLRLFLAGSANSETLESITLMREFHHFFHRSLCRPTTQPEDKLLYSDMAINVRSTAPIRRVNGGDTAVWFDAGSLCVREGVVRRGLARMPLVTAAAAAASRYLHVNLGESQAQASTCDQRNSQLARRYTQIYTHIIYVQMHMNKSYIYTHNCISLGVCIGRSNNRHTTRVNCLYRPTYALICGMH